jgi:hypothetical protein
MITSLRLARVDDEPLEELGVLDVNRLVETELLGRELKAGPRRLVTTALRAGRVLRRHEKDHERDERDDEEEQDRPEKSPDEISEHVPFLLVVPLAAESYLVTETTWGAG